MTDSRSTAGRPAEGFRELRSGRPTPLVALAVGLLVIGLGVVVAVPVSSSGLGALFIVVALLGPVTVLSHYWHTGIRLDGDGLTVGGVGRESTARRKPPPLAFQANQPLSCPWSAVQGWEVERGSAARRRLRRTHRRRQQAVGDIPFFPIGLWMPWFSRAWLVVSVRPSLVQAPTFRTQRGRRIQTFEVSVESDLWIVPTRRPDRLVAALLAVPAAARLRGPLQLTVE